MLGEASCVALGRVLSSDKLSALKVARNVLGEMGIQALAASLISTRSLTLLDLSGARLSDRSALTLVGALSRSPHSCMRTLQLHDNALSDDGGKALLHALTNPNNVPFPPYVTPGGGGANAARRLPVPSWSPRGAHGGNNGAADAVAHDDTQSAAAGAAAGGGGSGGGELTRCRLYSLTVHGNKVSHTTCGALRELCHANKMSDAVPERTTTTIAQLASCEPALHRIDHLLVAETAANQKAQAALSEVEAQLADVRQRHATVNRTAGDAAANASHAAAAADALTAAAAATLATELSAFEAKKAELTAQLHALLARRHQLEGMASSSASRSSPPSNRAAAGFELPAGMVAPAPIDAELFALQSTLSKRQELLDEQLLRHKRAHATRLWCEEQLGDIAKVMAMAKAKAKAKKK